MDYDVPPVKMTTKSKVDFIKTMKKTMTTKYIIDGCEFYSYHPRQATRWIGSIVIGLILAVVVIDILLTIYLKNI